MVSPFTFMPNMPAVPSVAGGLTIKSGASIGGDLTYTAIPETMIPPGTVSGDVLHKLPVIVTGKEQTVTEKTSSWFFTNLRNLVTLLIVGLLMVWLVPKLVQNGANAVNAKPLPSFGWGIVTIFGFFFALLALTTVVVIVAIVLGIVTLGDLLGTVIWAGIITAAGLIFGFSVAVGYVSKIIVSYVGGRLILTRLKPEWAEKPYWPVAFGVLIFAILVAIPLLGWIINLIVVLLGLGALWMLGWDKFKSRPAVVETPAVITD